MDIEKVRELVKLVEESGIEELEVAHHLNPGDTRRIHRLHELSEVTYVPLVATGDVRYAIPEDYRRYDLATCIRLGISVFEPHPERPRNAEAYLKSESALRRLIPPCRASGLS